MAAKKKKHDKGPVQRDSKHITYVRAAGMWCTTEITKGQQKQTWTVEKPA